MLNSMRGTKRITNCTFAILIGLLIWTPSIPAQNTSRDLQRVRFKPGQTKVVVKGMLPRGSSKRGYLLHAKAGQTLKVDLAPQTGNVIIQDIFGPDSKSLIPADADEDFWYGWKVKVTTTGDYSVFVGTTETAKRMNNYTLKLTLE